MPIIDLESLSEDLCEVIYTSIQPSIPVLERLRDLIPLSDPLVGWCFRAQETATEWLSQQTELVVFSLHSGLFYGYSSVEQTAALKSECDEAGIAYGCSDGFSGVENMLPSLRLGIVDFRRKEITSLGRSSSTSVYSLVVERQLQSLALARVLSDHRIDEAAFYIWLDYVFWHHRTYLHDIRRKLVEFLCLCTSDVSIGQFTAYPFYRTIEALYACYTLRDMRRVVHEGLENTISATKLDAIRNAGVCEGDSGHALVQRVLQKIADQPEAYEGLNELASACHVSAPHLCRLFRRYLDRTPYDVLTESKLEKAATLLMTTDNTVLEVGLETGFGNAAIFHRAFRKRYGVTPRKYRLTRASR